MKDRERSPKLFDEKKLELVLEELGKLNNKNRINRNYLEALINLKNLLNSKANPPEIVGKKTIDYANFLSLKGSDMSSRIKRLNHFMKQSGEQITDPNEKLALFVLDDLVHFQPSERSTILATMFWREGSEIVRIVKSKIAIKDYAKKVGVTEARIRRTLRRKIGKDISTVCIWTSKNRTYDYLLTSEALKILEETNWKEEDQVKSSEKARKNLELLIIVDKGRKAEETLRVANSYSKKRKRELELSVTSGLEARDELVRTNQGLVWSIAKKFDNNGVPLEDLVQEGSLGLMEGIRRFDHKLGYDFSTKAFWWIRQAITRCLSSQGRNIRLPSHMREQRNRLKREIQAYTAEHGRPPGERYLLKRGFTMITLKNLNAIPSELSLNEPIKGDKVLEDILAGTDEIKVLESRIDKRRVTELFEQLPPKEAMILRYRFGFNGEVLTLEEVGEKLSVTRERVRQIEEIALKKLKRLLQIKKADIPYED